MGRVTLLGSLLARPGETFTYAQPCEVADRCPVARTCQNLEVGRTYRVVERRNIHHTTCTEHEDGVDAVEVEPLPIVASFDEARLRGTLSKWSAPVCTMRGCPNWNTCFNPAMKPGVDYKILDPGTTMTCPMGYKLRRVHVETVAKATRG